jgi:hypothetical protein
MATKAAAWFLVDKRTRRGVGGFYRGNTVVVKGRDSHVDFIMNKKSIQWFLVWIHKGID